jgi:hypothetical protein
MSNPLRRHPILVTAFGLFAALALFFAVSFAWQSLTFSGAEREPVAGWMTVGYVARSWDLDPRTIDETAGLPQPTDRPLTLNEIATQRGVPVTEVIAIVEDTVALLLARRALGPGND